MSDTAQVLTAIILFLIIIIIIIVLSSRLFDVWRLFLGSGLNPSILGILIIIIIIVIVLNIPI